MSERQNAIKTSELVGIIQNLEARHKKLVAKMRADLKMKGRCLQEDMKTLTMLNKLVKLAKTKIPPPTKRFVDQLIESLMNEP